MRALDVCIGNFFNYTSYRKDIYFVTNIVFQPHQVLLNSCSCYYLLYADGFANIVLCDTGF